MHSDEVNLQYTQADRDRDRDTNNDVKLILNGLASHVIEDKENFDRLERRMSRAERWQARVTGIACVVSLMTGAAIREGIARLLPHR